MRKLQIILGICISSLLATILFSGCGVSNSRPEKPTVYIAEEFLELLKQEQAGQKPEADATISGDELENTEQIEESESIQEFQSSVSESESKEETETSESTQVEPLKQPAFIISELTEQDVLTIMERTIGTVLQCIPNKIYYSRASYEKTSEFAIQYLQKQVSMYEREFAVSYGDITGTSYTKYVSWSREKVGYYLDMLFGGQFSEYELVCDGDALLYYNEQYYIGIPEDIETYHVTVQYEKEDVDRSDFVYIMLEEDDGRERTSGQVAISVVKENMHYADRYIFEMIVDEK